MKKILVAVGVSSILMGAALAAAEEARNVSIRSSVSDSQLEAYGETLSYVVATNGVPVTDGTFYKDATVTVTVSSTKSDRIRIDELVGDPKGAVINGKTATWKIADNQNVMVRVQRPWSYTAKTETADATLTDGYWTFVVELLSAESKQLRLGLAKGKRMDGRTGCPWAFPAGTGHHGLSGEADLSGPVYLADAEQTEDNRFWISELASDAFKVDKDENLSYSSQLDGVVTSFIAPTNLLYMGSQVFCNNGVNAAGVLTNVVFRCPDLIGDSWSKKFCPNYEFNKQKVWRLVLEIPKVTAIGFNNMRYSDSTLAASDLSQWDLTGIKTLGSAALCAQSGPGPVGELRLPALETVTTNAFQNWERVTYLDLGSEGNLKSIKGKIFNAKTSTLETIDFGKSWDFTCEAEAFKKSIDNWGNPGTGTIPFKKLIFTDEAPSQETLDNILCEKAEEDDKSKLVKIYGPMSKPSWRALTDSAKGASELAEKARLTAAGERVRGIYRTAKGSRVAWLLQHPGIKYSSFFVIVR